MSSQTAPALESDLEAGLKLAALRHLAPEVREAAKVQRWAPEELLGTLAEAKIAARDASNEAARRRAAGFPMTRTLEDFALADPSVPRATFDYLAALEWIEAAPRGGAQAGTSSWPSTTGAGWL